MGKGSAMTALVQAGTGSQVRIERRGRVVLATLDNPPHALISAPMVAELLALVETAENDPGVGAVVLTGSHPDRFIAHYDIAELQRLAASAPKLSAGVAEAAVRCVEVAGTVPGATSLLRLTPAKGIVQLKELQRPLIKMGQSGVVYIAALNGEAFGNGCEVALACDIRLMSDQAGGIGQPELLLGFPPGAGGTQRLARLIGRARALEMVLEGRPISPEEAERIGLVHRVVPADRLLDEAMTVATRLARRSKGAVALAKRAILEGGSLPLDEGLRMEQAAFVACLPRSEAAAAMAAYVGDFESTGALPGFDGEKRRLLLEGEYVDFSKQIR
jgi:enoyl-CoA hydratase/carnithine racemase